MKQSPCNPGEETGRLPRLRLAMTAGRVLAIREKVVVGLVPEPDETDCLIDTTLIDIDTGWTEQRPLWGKGEIGVLE